MSRTQDAAAVVVAAIALVVAAWLDASVITDAQRQAAATFDPSGLAALFALGSVALGGGCLAVGWLGSRAAPIVALFYVLVGGFFALLPWLAFGPAQPINGAPGLLPDPIAQAIGEVYSRTQGPLNAVGVLGGAMLVAGLVAIARSLRRHGTADGAAITAPEPIRA
jgi:hypothetical protein